MHWGSPLTCVEGVNVQFFSVQSGDLRHGHGLDPIPRGRETSPELKTPTGPKRGASIARRCFLPLREPHLRRLSIIFLLHFYRS